MAGLNFNATNVPPQQAFENLAPGWYTAHIVESEMKPTSAGTGSFIELTIEVIAPAQFAGRKLWDRLNVNNPNEKAVEIAYQTLSAICHSTGVIQVQDTQQLHQIPMDVKVGMSKVTAEYPEARNEIKGYRACQGGGTGQQAPQGQQYAPQGQQQQQAAPQGQQNAQYAPQQQQQVNQQANPQGQWQQQQGQQQVVQQSQQQQVDPNAGQQQQAQTGATNWQNAQADTGQNVQQQNTQQAAQQEAAPEMQIQQQQTDPNAQAAAQGGKAPWQQ